MNFIIWLVIGGLIGWAVSTRTIDQGNFDTASLVVSFLGAVILLALLNLVRRGAPRWVARHRAS